jgi:hypothetical protein
MRKVTFILLLVFSCTLHAQVKTIQGQLTKDGKPLSKTYFYVQNRNITGKTDRNGYFVLKNVTDDDVIEAYCRPEGYTKTFKITDVTKSVLSITETPAVPLQIESETDTVGVKFLTGNEKYVHYRYSLSKIASITKDTSGYKIAETGQSIPQKQEINFTSFVEAGNIGRLPELQSQYAQDRAAGFFNTGISFGNALDVKFSSFKESVASVGLGQRKNNSPIPNAYKEAYNASFIIDEVTTGRFKSTGGLLYKNSYEKLMQRGGNLSSLLYPVLTDPSLSEPSMLVNQLPDRNKNDYMMAYAHTNYSNKNKDFFVHAELSFDKQWDKIRDGILAYPSNHYTDRQEEITNMIAYIHFHYEINRYISVTPLAYGFKRTIDDVNRYDSNTTQNNILTDKNLARNAQDLGYSVMLRYDEAVFLTINNKYYFSNTLASSSYTNMFPEAIFKWRISETKFLSDIFDWDWDWKYFHNIALRGSIKKSTGESSLVFRNPAALSTSMNAVNFRSYYEYTDIFHHDRLAAETYTKGEIGIDYNYHHRFSITADYFNNKTKNYISPVLNGQDNLLQNIGEIQNSGYNISIGYYRNGYYYNNFRKYDNKPSYDIFLTFNRTKSKVTDVYNGYSVVPLAGFADIATVFAKNEPFSAIYGTTYQRDEQGGLVIGDDGRPLVDRQLKKIGDPTPDFVMSLVPSINWYNFKLLLTMEYSHGGQRWNGTRACLDYLRIAEETGDPVRSDIRPEQYGYGITGAGEEYIEDATYFRFSDIALSYSFKLKGKENKTFGSMEIGLRAQNLLWITPYKGVNPSSSLFGYSTGNGLDLFNMPSLRTYSLIASIKF